LLILTSAVSASSFFLTVPGSNFVFYDINNCGFAFVYFQYAFAATAVTSE
jgi:hypothetical protein